MHNADIGKGPIKGAMHELVDELYVDPDEIAYMHGILDGLFASFYPLFKCNKCDKWVDCIKDLILCEECLVKWNAKDAIKK